MIADMAQQLKPVHLWHFYVRKYGRRFFDIQLVQGSQAVCCKCYAIASAFEQAFGDAAYGNGIINHQHQRLDFGRDRYIDCAMCFAAEYGWVGAVCAKSANLPVINNRQRYRVVDG